MDAAATFTEIDNTLADFIQTLSLFTDEQINKIPFDGCWTPGQVAQHVILSISGFVDLLYGPVADTDRPADKYVGNLKETFLNFNIKFQSPVAVIPPAIDYKKEKLLHTLDQQKNNLHKFDLTTDMTKTCAAVEIPVFGFLTRTEVAHFIIYHTQRHVHQLKQIYQKLNHIK